MNSTPIPVRTVGIVIFPDVEVLDFCGPFEVFSVTRLDETRRRESESPYRVLLIAASLYERWARSHASTSSAWRSGGKTG